jgi:hypothetical protein
VIFIFQELLQCNNGKSFHGTAVEAECSARVVGYRWLNPGATMTKVSIARGEGGPSIAQAEGSLSEFDCLLDSEIIIFPGRRRCLATLADWDRAEDPYL